MRDCETRAGLTRRHALGAAGALFAWAHAPRSAFAAQGRDARLLVVILRGALDGLSAVAPVGDPDYAELRGPIALQRSGEGAGLSLDGFFFAHPALPNFARLYAQRQALVVHAAATGYRERSHFDGQDVLESGQPGPGLVRSGWLNRLAQALPAGEAIKRTNLLGVGPTAPLIVRGEAPVLGWSPPAIRHAQGDLTARLERLYDARDPMLAQALRRALDTEALAARGGMADERARGGPASPQGMAQIAAAAAKLMAAPDGPRLAALAFEGWDTHANEGGAKGQLAGRLAGLDAAFGEFETGLGPVWKDTAVLALTEFGRTARTNGTIGTDHGTGTVALLAGGAVKGGRIVADWPGLKVGQLHQGRDLKPTVDVRAVCKGLAQELFGVSDRTLANAVFPDTLGVAPLRGLTG